MNGDGEIEVVIAYQLASAGRSHHPAATSIFAYSVWSVKPLCYLLHRQHNALEIPMNGVKYIVLEDLGLVCALTPRPARFFQLRF